MSLVVLYFLHSPSVLPFCIDVVLTLSILYNGQEFSTDFLALLMFTHIIQICQLYFPSNSFFILITLTWHIA